MGHRAAMTVYVAWLSAEPVEELAGPWREVRRAGEGLLLIDSDEALSPVYHAVKWSLPTDAALMVAPLASTPKLRGLPQGTLAWLRHRSHL